jgi:methylmalonyl-CoA mutase
MTTASPFRPVSFEDWSSAVEAELEGRPTSSLHTKLLEGVTVRPLEVSRPTGPAATVERGAIGVVVAPRHAHPDPEAVRRALQDDVLGGATGLFMQFGRACRFGLDGDHPAALEHLVEGGTAIGQARDLTNAVELGASRLEVLAFDAGANAVPLLALVEATLAGLGVDRARQVVHAGFDPIGALLRDGAVPADIDVLWREAATTLRAIDPQTHPTKLIVADGTIVHAAGAHAALELAVLWASGLEAFDRLTQEGIAPERAASEIVFRTAIGRDVFVELAKLRALRLGWQKILRAAGLAEAPPATIHACVSSRILARRDPWVNMLRGTGALWSALLGGAELVTPAAWDEAIGEPDSTTRRIARNQALVLLEESHLGAPLDPAAGSFAIEQLTRDLGEAAWSLLQEIEAEGGILAAVESGTLQARVRAAADARLEAVAKRKEPIVGVGEFPNLDEQPVVRRDVRDRKSATSLADIAATSRRMRASAPPPAFAKGDGFTELRALAGRNATVSELGRALARRGEGPSVERLRAMRDAAPFERLRDRVERLARGRGKAPTVTLVTFGASKEYRTRTAYTSNAFAAAGFRTVTRAFEEISGPLAGAACLCTSDALLTSDGVRLAKELRRLEASPLVVAGKVPAVEHELAQAGVTQTLFAGGDLVALLEALVTAEEARP